MCVFRFFASYEREPPPSRRAQPSVGTAIQRLDLPDAKQQQKRTTEDNNIRNELLVLVFKTNALCYKLLNIVHSLFLI